MLKWGWPSSLSYEEGGELSLGQINKKDRALMCFQFAFPYGELEIQILVDYLLKISTKLFGILLYHDDMINTEHKNQEQPSRSPWPGDFPGPPSSEGLWAWFPNPATKTADSRKLEVN